MACFRRCLICYSEDVVASGHLEPPNSSCGGMSSSTATEKVSAFPFQPQPPTTTLALSSCSKQQMFAELDVIFTLRNVLEVPQGDIANHLIKWGSPSNWIRFCDRCKEAVTNAKTIYHEILDASRIFRSVKQEIIEMVKKSLIAGSQSNKSEESGKTCNNDITIMEITDISRDFVGKRDYGTVTDPFIRGDLKAREFAQTYCHAIVDEPEEHPIEGGQDNKETTSSSMIKDEETIMPPLTTSKVQGYETGDISAIRTLDNPNEETQMEVVQDSVDHDQYHNEKSTGTVYEEEMVLMPMPPPIQLEKCKEINLTNSNCCDIESSTVNTENYHTETTITACGEQKTVISATCSIPTVEKVSQNNTDGNVKEDCPSPSSITVLAKEEQELDSDLKADSTLLKGENSHLDQSNKTPATTLQTDSDPTKDEKHNPITPPQEGKIIAESAILKPANTIQLNFKIPRFPLIKQMSKVVAEVKSGIKSDEVKTFTFPKVPILANGTKEAKRSFRKNNNGPSKTTQSNSSKDELNVSTVNANATLNNVQCIDKRATAASKSSSSLLSSPPDFQTISNGKVGISNELFVNNQPLQSSSPQQQVPCSTITPSTLENQSSSFVDLDPFLEELLNLPLTLTQNLPKTTLNNNVNQTHGKCGKLTGENGKITHLCLCRKSYTTNSKLNRHINQMMRKTSNISSSTLPPSRPNGIQEAMKEMRYLQEQQQQHVAKRKKDQQQNSIDCVKTTSIAANKILQRYSPRKRAHNVAQAMPPNNNNNKYNYRSSLFQAMTESDMGKVPNQQQFASLAELQGSVLPQNFQKQQLIFPRSQENVVKQNSFAAEIHRQRIQLPSSSVCHQRYTSRVKPRPSFSQFVANKQQCASRSHPTFKSSSTHSTTTTPKQPLPLPSTAHSAKKWYPCGQCLNRKNAAGGDGGIVKRFWSIAELTNHIHSVHGGWKCKMPNCERRFSTHAALKIHVMKQQCNTIEAFATSQARLLKTTPISISKATIPQVPKLISMNRTKNTDKDIICIELDD